MNEKPFHLPMPFSEALKRLSRLPNKVKHNQSLDYAKIAEKNVNTSATKKPRQSQNTPILLGGI